MRTGVSRPFSLLVLLFFLPSFVASTLDAFARDVSVRPNLTLRQSEVSLSDLAGGNRDGSYTAIRAMAPGAVVFTDAIPQDFDDWNTLSPVFLLALAEVSEIRFRDLSRLVPPDGVPTMIGSARHGPWSLHLKEAVEPATALLITEADGVLYIVDARLAPALLAEDFSIVPTASIRVPAVAGAVADGVLLLLLFLVGGLFLPRESLSRGHRLGLALPLGIAAYGALGLLRLPGLWSLVALALVSCGAYLWGARQGYRPGWAGADLPWLVSVGAILALVAAWSRANGFIWPTADSISYLARARLLADGNLTPGMVELKRGAAQQQLHAPSFALGVEGFQSLGAAALVLGVVLLLLAPSVLDGSTGVDADWRSPGAVAAFAAAGLLLFSPAIPVIAAYINSHMLLAVLLLTIVLLLAICGGGLGQDDFARTLIPAVAAVLTAIVLLRPEGTLLAALVLMGTLRSGSPAHRALWWWLGTATLAWNAMLIRGAFERGEPPASIVFAMTALGLLLLIVPALLARMTDGMRRAVPLLVGGALWTATLVLLVGDVGNIRFLDVAIINIGEAQGRWGAAGVLLFLIGLVAVAARERPDDGPGVLGARWVLIGFIPLTMFAKLGDGLQAIDSDFGTLLRGGGRVGWGDSVNRMWTHAILLVLMLFIVRVMQWSRRDEDLDSPEPGTTISVTDSLAGR